MKYLDEIFNNVGRAAVDASTEYLDNVIDGIKYGNEPVTSTAPIQTMIENNQPAKDYSGLMFAGFGVVAIVAAFLLFRKKGK